VVAQARHGAGQRNEENWFTIKYKT
jgi:hypothetical protein